LGRASVGKAQKIEAIKKKGPRPMIQKVKKKVKLGPLDSIKRGDLEKDPILSRNIRDGSGRESAQKKRRRGRSLGMSFTKERRREGAGYPKMGRYVRRK